jgi:hypothetical protein
MSILREFLATRETEVREQIKLLREELAELKRAKAAIEQADVPDDSASDSEVRDSSRMTIKDMIRSVLARPEAANGMAAGELLDAINRAFSTVIERTSLSPQLSRLRDSGDAVLQDGRWYSSEPRLSQAVAVAPRSRNQKFYGGGEAIHDATRTAYERAKLATFATENAAEETLKMVRASLISNNAAEMVKFATGSVASASAIEAATQASKLASATAAQSMTPHTAKAIEEADRKLRTLIHGPDQRGTNRNWSLGSKTE